MAEQLTQNQAIEIVMDLIHDNNLNCIIMIEDATHKYFAGHICQHMSEQGLIECIGKCMQQITQKNKDEEFSKN